MLSEFTYRPENIGQFKDQALKWAASSEVACFFDSNGFSDPYSAFEVLIAAGSRAELSCPAGNAFDQLQEFIDRHKAWMLGFLSYDLKNELENLTSDNADYLHFPDLFFFIPRHLLLIKGQEVEIFSETPEKVVQEISAQKISPLQASTSNRKVRSRIKQEEYIRIVEQLKKHILRGDIYEVNLCQEFFIEDIAIDPLAAFRGLNSISPTPFANFVKVYDKYIISATPERFLSKRDSKLISQPIKGTAKRSRDEKEDRRIKEHLRNDPKEQAENVMIVDLVRNDLTKSAQPGTVHVEELFGIYSFSQVHQMISTVVCEADPALPLTDLIKNAFPMGSMTGAPKLRAMELIEDYEQTKRGVFSGAVGYLSPNGNFDFNVIIRTLLYNQDTSYLSFQTGSAITFDADPQKEYQECLLKAEAIMQVLGGKF